MKPEPEAEQGPGRERIWSRVMVLGLAALWITTLAAAGFLAFGN
jgi:hypothetical protein